MIEPYNVGVIQQHIVVAHSREDVQRNVRRLVHLIGYVGGGHSDFPVRLVVAPEAALTSVHASPACPSPKDIAWFNDNLAITIPGPEIEELGRVCREHNLYFCASVYTREERWPDRFFNTGIIIGPEGKVILKYQKAQSNTQLTITPAPHDMWDEWSAVYGDRLEDFFPVVDTQIGKLGVCICYDRVFPEVGRAYAVQGCEILCNPTVWTDPWTSAVEDTWQIVSRAQAIQNVMYFVAPNAGSVGDRNDQYPLAIACGKSMIVDYRGRVLAYADHGGETILTAVVNIPELRRHRLQNKFLNPLPHIRSEVYAKIYERPLWPRNRFGRQPAQSVSEIHAIHTEVVRRLAEERVFLPPDYVGPVPASIE